MRPLAQGVEACFLMNVKGYNQHQDLLFPPRLREALPEDHLAIVVDDVVESMDLNMLYNKVPSEGNPSYHPKMMLKILLYAYANGLFSSRKIQKALSESIAFIYLAGWQKPDFRTISDFRKNNLRELKTLFAQGVKICDRLGMVSLGHIAIDGSKFRANASDRQTYDEKKVDQEIARLLEKAACIDHQEDELLGSSLSGEEVPVELQKQEKRLARLQKIRQELQASGKEKVNATDPDAVFMKTQGAIRTSYNAQVAVEEKNQVIVATDVTDQPCDVEQLVPIVEKVQHTLGKMTTLTADSGYSSGENLKELHLKGIDAYIPDPEYQGQQRKEAEEPFFHRSRFFRNEEQDCFICPAGKKLMFSYYQKRGKRAPLRIYRCRECSLCPLKPQCTKGSSGRSIALYPYDKELKAMRAKLDSEEGKRIYKKRQAIVEAVFGHLKEIIGFVRFHLRGLKKVCGEFALICLAHNIRKISTWCKSRELTYGAALGG